MLEAAISHQPNSSFQNQLCFLKMNNVFIVTMFTITVISIFHPPLPHEPKLSKYSILSWYAYAEKQKQFCSQRKRMLAIELVAQRLNVQKLFLFVNLKSVKLQHTLVWVFFSDVHYCYVYCLTNVTWKTHFRAQIIYLHWYLSLHYTLREVLCGDPFLLR